MDKPLVLIVEDDNNVLDAIRRVIEQSGCVAITSNSFRQALELAREQKIAFAITDWDLNSEKTGVDIGRALQAINSNTLLVFITGKSVTELQAVASDLHIHTVLEKPVSLKILRALVDELLDKLAANYDPE